MNLDDATIGDLGILMGEALTEQVALQIEVTKAEVARDARAALRGLAPLAVAIPFAGVGVVFLLVGCVLALVPWVGPAGSALLVGGAVVLSSAVGARVALSRPETRWLLPLANAGGYRVR